MLKVIGAGLPRTGTMSLKYALRDLLGGRCYHNSEVHIGRTHVPEWTAALAGEPDWDRVYDGYVAAVDWPTSAFWAELMEAYPDALVLLSLREDAAAWWRSMDTTVMESFRHPVGRTRPEGWRMAYGVWEKAFGEPFFDDAERLMRAYDEHVRRVREGVPADRLVEWTVGDGWEPLCAALGVAVPEGEAFPHLNTGAEWQEARAAVTG